MLHVGPFASREASAGLGAEYSAEYRPRVSRSACLRVGRRPLAVRSWLAHCWVCSRGLRCPPHRQIGTTVGTKPAGRGFESIDGTDMTMQGGRFPRWSRCCAKRSGGSMNRPNRPGVEPQRSAALSQDSAEHSTYATAHSNHQHRHPIEGSFRDATRRTYRACRGRSIGRGPGQKLEGSFRDATRRIYRACRGRSTYRAVPGGARGA